MKKEKKQETKQKKKSKVKIIIMISLLVVLVSVSILGYFYYNKNYRYSFKLNKKEISVKLGDTINPDKYIKNKKNVKVSYTSVKTDTVGKKSIIYTVVDKFNNKHSYFLDVKVIDDIAPTIEAKDKISLYVGDKLDLKKYVKAKDNYDKEVDITTEGEVDMNKEGDYKVKYIATDKSGNKKEHTITFTIKKRSIYEPVKLENGSIGTSSKGYKIENKGGATYVNGILIANKTYILSSSYGGGLRESTKNAFNEMKAAAALDGFDLRIGSGYRSFNSQKTIYKNYVKRDGQAKADTYSARPGHSEHQTGLAIDICASGYKCIGSGFNGTPPANWLSDNAYKYGFILRYPNGKTNETGYKFESWHYRYVGKDLAAKLYNNGNWITLEDYLGITSKYSE